MGKALIFSGIQIDSPLQKVTLIQAGLINPTLIISSNNEETDTTFSFTISADNAIKVCYIVKESSEGAPSDIFSEGQSITISELPKKITVSGRSPETTYIIYAGAMSSDNVKVEKNISITTEEKVLTTADDYVQAYKSKVNGLTEKQESSLLAFVDTVISNGIWDKVQYFFPLIKGTNYQAYDLKSVKDIGFIARTPSYNSEKDCLHIGYDGLATCTTSDIDLDINNMTSIISYNGVCNFFAPVSLGVANSQIDYIRFGGNKKEISTYWLNDYPTINDKSVTVADESSSTSWESGSSENMDKIVTLSIQDNTASSSVYNINKSRKYSKDGVSFEFDESYKNLERFPLKLGGYYGVESDTQPMNVDLYCVFISSKLSENELTIASKAINKLNNDLGRYTGELVE